MHKEGKVGGVFIVLVLVNCGDHKPCERKWCGQRGRLKTKIFSDAEHGQRPPRNFGMGFGNVKRGDKGMQERKGRDNLSIIKGGVRCVDRGGKTRLR